MVDRDSKPLSLRALSRETGIPATTLSQWTRAGLTLDDAGMCSKAELLRFCMSDAARRRRVAVTYAERVAAATAMSAPSTWPNAEGLVGDEHLRAIARDVRTAAVANVEALLVAARQAEDVARGHREQIEALVLSFRALDSALVEVTTTTTPHS